MTLWCVFDLANKEAEIAGLEERASSPDLWEDTEAAQRVLKQLADVRQEVTSWTALAEESRTGPRGSG